MRGRWTPERAQRDAQAVAGQRFGAGVLLAAALVWIPQLEDVASPLVVVHCRFVLEVVYAFAVDHRAGAGGVENDRADACAPIRELAGTDRAAFITLMSAAFARDPWIEAALGLATDPAAEARCSSGPGGLRRASPRPPPLG